LRTSRVECELNGGKVPLSPRSGGDGSGVRVEACANSGDYCEECLRSVQVAPLLLSLFDEESFLAGMNDHFQAWLRDPSRKDKLVTQFRLCSAKCLRTLLKGHVRARVVRGESEVRWVVKVAAQSYTDTQGNRLRHVSLFWFGEPGAHTMPGGIVVRHCLPTKEACQVFDGEFGGPLAPPRPPRGPRIPDLIGDAGEPERDESSLPEESPAPRANLSAARSAEEAGNWDEAIRLYLMVQMPDEARRVRTAKAAALAGAGKFKQAAEVYDQLGMKAEAKVMRKRDFEVQAERSGFGKDESPLASAAPAIGKAAPTTPPPAASPPKRAGWVVCPSCKKLLGRGFEGAECPNCGAPLAISATESAR
jgi:hypothetical protein